MIFRIKYCVPVFFLIAAGCAAGPAIRTDSPQTAAAGIRNFYEKNYVLLSPARRGHWALRLYRISGDPADLPFLQSYGRALLERFRNYAAGAEEPAFRESAALKTLGTVPPASAKLVKRQEVLKRRLEYVYAQKWLYLAFQLKSLGLAEEAGRSFLQALEYLKHFAFKDYVLDPEVILYDASEAANTVYYLQDLGLAELEIEFIAEFRRLARMTDEKDDVIYENRLYGMTHVIIAASGYYQRSVPAEKFAWITDYFDKNIETLLRRGKPDIAAEAALCFQLTGQSARPAVARIRQYLLKARNAAGVIPSPSGHFDLNKAEHRNVLAVIALQDFERLYPGPDLSYNAAS